MKKVFKVEVPSETFWINTKTGKVLDEDSGRVMDKLIAADNKVEVHVGSLWIDKKDGKVMEEDTGRTLHLKDAVFIEDPQHNQVILKGKSYGKEIQTALPSEEFALGTQFCFSQATLADVEQRKKEMYHVQELKSVERV